VPKRRIIEFGKKNPDRNQGTKKGKVRLVVPKDSYRLGKETVVRICLGSFC